MVGAGGRAWRAWAVAGAMVLAIPTVLAGQTRADAGWPDGRGPGASLVLPSAPAQDTARPPPASPGGAFVRSLLVPGWGQAAVGSYTRAGFYFTTSSATLWMLFKTNRALQEAEAARDLVESEVEYQLRREGITHPDTIAARLDADSRVEERQQLVDSRSQQMEDWTAFGIFWLLLNAADAFVAAHLWDFPEPVEVEWAPVAPRARTELRLRIPLGPPGR